MNVPADSEHLKRFLETVSNGSPITLNSFTSHRKGAVFAKQFHDIESAVSWAIEESSKGNLLYWTVQTMGPLVSERGRGTSADVTQINAVPSDIDLRSKTRPATDAELEEAKRAALKMSLHIVYAGLGVPMLIHSGSGGFYVIPYFSPPFIVHTAEERAEARDLMMRFQREMQRQFENDHVKLDSVVDLARVLALPGVPKNKRVGVDAYTDERPNRIVKVLDPGIPTTWERFKAFASSLPETDAIEAEDVDLKKVDLPGDFKIPEDAMAILRWDEAAQIRFKGDKSDAEFNAAVRLARRGLDPNTIYTILLKGPIYKLKPKSLGYYRRTIGKALALSLANAEEETRLQRELSDLGLHQPEIQEPELAIDVPVEPPVLEGPKTPPITPEAQAFIMEEMPQVASDLGREFACTDLGNSERFIARFGDYVRFVEKWGKWVIFDRQRWRLDDGSYILMVAKHVIRMIPREAPYSKDPKAILKWATGSEALTRAKAMIGFAKTHVISPDDLDTAPWLFNVSNGTIDLQTGALRPHSKENLITLLSPVRYDPEAKCPNFLTFLEKVMPDQEMRDHLQLFVGYSLTGLTKERKFRIDWGPLGRNGKSTLYNVLIAMFGEYSTTVMFDTFGTKKEGQIRNDLASLVGKRLVVAIESEPTFQLNVNMLKSLTGEDRIRARFLYHEDFTFQPTFKIWLASNNRPRIYDSTNPIWDRMHLIEWSIRIPEDEIISGYAEKFLFPELSGVLNWAIEGCLKWQKLDEIPEIPQITAAKQIYRNEEYVLYDFIEDMCETEEGLESNFKDLFTTYKIWCGLNDIRKPLGIRNFGSSLRERFGFRVKDGYKVYLGVRPRATMRDA